MEREGSANPLGKGSISLHRECVLVSGVLCFLEGVEGLNGGSVAVPRIGWGSDNCLLLPISGSAAVPCNPAIGHISQLAQVAVCSVRVLGKF